MDSGGFEARWRKRFGEYAAGRDDDAGIAGWTATGLDARVRKFFSLWEEPRTVQLWLDAGCGAGTYARLLSTRGMRVVGVDYSFASVMKARDRDCSGTAYVAADIRNMPFRGGSFQGVVCFGVTQALLRSDELVEELASMLAPSGELWIDGLNAHCVPHVIERIRRRMTGRSMHLRHEAPSQVVRLMRRAGLTDIERYWLPIAPSRMRRLQRFFEHWLVCKLLHLLAPIGSLVSHSFIVRGRRPRA